MVSPPQNNSYYSECAQTMIPGTLIPLEYISGDFNGDGLTDIIGIAKPHTYITGEHYDFEFNSCSPNFGFSTVAKTYFINMDRRLNDEAQEIGTLLQPYDSIDKLYTADFNGDGKTDIMHVRNGIVYVYGLNATNQLVLLWQKSNSRIKTTLPLLLGDYNGDGKIDFMQPVANEGSDRNLYVHLYSTGNDFKVFEKRHSFNYDKPLQDGNTLYIYSLIPTDLNSDGKTDLLYTRTKTVTNSSSGEIITIAFYNTGMPNFLEAHSFISSGINTRYATLRHHPIPIALNPTKPNHRLEFGFISHNTITLYNFLRDVSKETRLKSVFQDGVSHSFNYQTPIEESDPYDYMPFYSSSSSLTYPYNNLRLIPGLNMVKRIDRVTSSNTLRQIFSYKNAVTNVEGLGFMGFGEIIKSNWHADEYDENKIFNINIHNPLLRGSLVKSFTSKNPYISSLISNVAASEPHLKMNDVQTAAKTVKASQTVSLLPGFQANASNGAFIATIANPATGVADGATLNDYITRTDYTYQAELLSNKVYKNLATSISVKDNLSGTNTLKTFEYDSYLNLVKEQQNFSGQGTTITEMTYSNDVGNTNYHIGRPLNKKTTANAAGDVYTTEEEYTYTDYLPTQIKKKGHSTPFITENLTYDNFGNILSKTLVTADGQRTSSKTYDPTGRFVVSETDTEGMTTTYTHNLITGSVLSRTNPYNQTESFVYDSWGNLIETTNYLGYKSYTSYSKSGFDTYIFQSNDEGQEAHEIINNLGQKIQSSSKDLLGQWINSDIEYDIYGRLKKQSEPYFSNSTVSQWNETTYDEYGRSTSTTSYTGKVTNISYNGLTTTVNDGTKTTITTKNALGQIASVQDPGGTINYIYDAAGNLKTANYDGIAQQITYDGWGRKIQLTDPSAGVYQYTYDQFGQVLQEITPKGTTTYTYLPSGRLNSKIITGDATNMSYQYTYDASTRLLTQLNLTNADGNNANYTYSYDNYKRLLSTVEDNTYARFTKTLEYDMFGKVFSETSEAKNKANNKVAQKTLLFEYMSGEVFALHDGQTGQVIHQSIGLNERGQPTASYFEGGQRLINTYDQYGYIQQSQLERYMNNPSVLMTLGYTFNTSRGLLTNRSNSAFSWNDSFAYDSQDRLTNFNDNNGNNSHIYDNKGRITNNSQLGDYTYNNYQQTQLNNLVSTAQTWYQDRALQQINYNAFKSPVEINEEGKERISFQYNAGLQRAHMYYGSTATEKMDRPYRRHYSEDGTMEITEDIQNGTTNFVFYLGGDAYSAPAIWKEIHHSNAQPLDAQLYFLHRDHLGSIVMITDAAGNIAEKRQFDAWGNIVKLENGNGVPLSAFVILDRGYTGHEHLLGVGLIHMNGRLYDPKLHRFLQPDNYVQDPYNSQNFNRYGYVLNNPLSHVDPSGEFIFTTLAAIFCPPLLPVAIGADLGMWSGGSMANGTANPFKWDYSSGKTWGYMLGGAITGGLSGGVANTIATSGIAFSNTLAIAGGSLINSAGTYMYTGGKTDLSINFGFGSYNFSTGEFGYLGKKGNSFMENLGYGLGTLANVSDVLAGFKPGEVQLNTENSDAIGHSALTKVGETNPDNSLVSVGPDPGGKWIFNPFKFKKGTNSWKNYVDAGDDVSKVSVRGVNLERIANYGSNLNKGVNYNLYFSSCVNHTARALTLAGVPAIGIHPFILHSQMVLRSIGIRPMLYSYHLYQY
ncbi:hypothetical protein FYC62_03435 [Pedobacter aquae]|uniref:Teneurin-like YD-shell domain-containing protein n=1 Tax=Pedobacter aquae TaxID=2605747 RepID=A0A5C0VDR8_9SPHI|nr:RHS repeat-associated core domain-containing protein [Pedobacter aquae]QEK50828.1 hypothetical protein FYC62_03435 [Pedobacter aquae]